MSTIVGWIFIVGSLLSAGVAIANRLREGRARAWPWVQGTVMDVGTVDGRVRIQYRYRVGDVIHLGDRITMSILPATSRAERRRLRAYKTGDAIRVFHDPDDPGSAVLERRITAGWGVIVVLSGIFVVLGLSLVLGYSR